MSGKQGRPRSETMAMASRNAIPGVKEQLANVAKLISEAQTLDGNGDELVKLCLNIYNFYLFGKTILLCILYSSELP